MESGFFKAVPNNTSGHRMDEKCGFIWMDNPDEKKLALIATLVGNRYYDGCDLIPVDKNDIEFQEYINNDLIKNSKRNG